MLTTSHTSETWDLMNRGTDPEGRPQCHVRRRTLGVAGVATVWRLVKFEGRAKRSNGWRNVGQYTSGRDGYHPSPEKNGVALSTSRTDLTLFSFAEHGHGNAYA